MTNPEFSSPAHDAPRQTMTQAGDLLRRIAEQREINQRLLAPIPINTTRALADVAMSSLGAMSGEVENKGIANKMAVYETPKPMQAIFRVEPILPKPYLVFRHTYYSPDPKYVPFGQPPQNYPGLLWRYLTTSSEVIYSV